MSCPHCGEPFSTTGRRDRIYCTETRRWEHPALTSEDATIRAAACRVQQLGEAHGWSPSTIRCAMDGLTVLLAGRPAGEPVTITEIRTRTPRRTSSLRVAEVLTDLGLLVSDTTPSIRTWIDRRTSELPAGFADDLCAWLLVLLDGDARTRPRSQSSLYVYFGTVRPFIEHWGGGWPQPLTGDHHR